MEQLLILKEIKSQIEDFHNSNISNTKERIAKPSKRSYPFVIPTSLSIYRSYQPTDSKIATIRIRVSESETVHLHLPPTKEESRPTLKGRLSTAYIYRTSIE